MDGLQDIHPGVSFHVVTEAVAGTSVRNALSIYEFVTIVLVPEAFAASRARYKARALEYFRIQYKLQANDWILHLDEETVIDKDCMTACIDFVTSNNAAAIAQVNPNRPRPWYSTLTESNRV